MGSVQSVVVAFAVCTLRGVAEDKGVYAMLGANTMCSGNPVGPDPACIGCSLQACERACDVQEGCTALAYHPFKRAGSCKLFDSCPLRSSPSKWFVTYERVEGDTCDAGGCWASRFPETIPGVEVLLPQAMSHVSSAPRPLGVPEHCCWRSFQVLYDNASKVVLLSAEHFLCSPDDVVRFAQRPGDYGFSWTDSDIHPHPKIADPHEAKLRGNGFPGARIHVHSHPFGKMISQCLEPMVKVVWPGFNLFSASRTHHSISLVSSARQPQGMWLDAQRNPHNDVQWELGLLEPSKVVPPSLATVYGLAHGFNDTGTSIWRTKRTIRNPEERLSLLETLQENEVSQGVFSGKASPRVPDVDVRKEIPGSCPQEVTSHVWAEATAVVRTHYNRMVLYDGRRLHNQWAEPGACSRFSLDPHVGRLTLNSFYWHTADTVSKRWLEDNGI
mmetsp:Transcript_5179/g.14582  ORF Transcript_5179/g.14582 Transcript_5179/m.14582 type:complete len:443 (-) Transcript_5179:502-1830(-)|eukprot:CAMPEP_0194479990 /NCGR_PEP_ID=MMETSP0253-20130528/2937_1 /TAXON_ID=2966 /ORGANISM="Noctiluca scintillans" /LENGTH=442 /DNA_ID=CAMNT_0039319303 /DNA_START=25 /DNA_END=1353 /DNA_ORIENTATION=+